MQPSVSPRVVFSVENRLSNYAGKLYEKTTPADTVKMVTKSNDTMNHDGENLPCSPHSINVVCE